LLVGGCEYDLDVGAHWQISQPRVIAFRMEVVEPAPIWPDRLAGNVSDGPIAEALPGDRVRLQPLVVDGEGRPQAPESIDAIWFQCTAEVDFFGGGDCLVDVPPCELIDWMTDVGCELGRGRGLEYTFPPLGPGGFRDRSMKLLGIIGRTPEADAERCRAGFLAGTGELSECTLVEAYVAIGPRWVLQHVGAEAGFEPELPLVEIPYLAMLQPANRAPAPGLPVWLDTETKQPLQGSPPRVRPGQRVETVGPSWSATDRQPYAYWQRATIVAGYESRGAGYFASGPIWFSIVDGSALQFEVDEGAPAGLVRVVIIVGDERRGDTSGAIDMLVAELEVVP
jgi:hypothetical protein